VIIRPLVANSGADYKFPKQNLPENKPNEANNEPKQQEIPKIRQIVEDLKKPTTRSLDEGIKQLFEVLSNHPGIIVPPHSLLKFFRS